MKVVILAGGNQSTLSDSKEGIPKPMIEIGARPLLWHIMKHFSEYGLKEFVICGGYRVDMIKEYFMDFYIYESDITVDLSDNSIKIHKKKTEDWKVTVVDTGKDATPGQRIQMVQRYLPEEDFVVTYGDCLSDIDVNALLQKHQQSQMPLTLVVAKPQGRKQLLSLDEKGALQYELLNPVVANAVWVNANCFVLHKSVLACLEGECDMETQLFKPLSEQGRLAAFQHEGFWMTVETMRDFVEAQRLWKEGRAPWLRE